MAFNTLGEDRYSGSGFRALVLMGVVLLGLGGVLGRLAYLQLAEGPTYRERAEKNRIRPWYRAPGRGELLDRKGRVLASRSQVYSLYLDPSENSKEVWPTVLERLAPRVNKTTAEMVELLERKGYRSPVPVRLVQNLDPGLITFFNEYQQDLPGVSVIAESVRSYPHGSSAAQIIGYTGEISDVELERRKGEGQDYRGGDIVGKIGAERTFEEALHGTWGGELREVNAAGQKIRNLGTIEAKTGESVALTLDIEMQKVAEAALGNRLGAVAVVDVNTGGVLTLASSPRFDPNMFSRRIKPDEWRAFQALKFPMLNRAVRPYPPASTFKIVMTAAALESGLFKPESKLRTSGSYRVGGRAFKEHNGRGWGVIGFERALAVSADTFFYQIGLKLGPDRISAMSRNFGYGERTALNLSSESPGLVPSDAWKRKVYKDYWRPGDTANYAIGQGYLLSTPLQNALMVAAIANGGYYVAPHIKKDMAPQKRSLGLTPTTLKIIQNGLKAVTSPGGTAYKALGSIGVSNAGKTGTAEALNRRTNAVYVGYAPFDKPQIAVSVMIEEGGHGGSDAAPIAAQVYRHYFGLKMPKK